MFRYENQAVMKYLSHYRNQAQSELFERTGAFFAFGDAQFNEKKKEGVEYMVMGGGLVSPVANVAEINKCLKEIEKVAIAADVKENGAEGIIRREYFNYECQLVWDTSDAEAALVGHIEQFPELFTPEVLRTVFAGCKQYALDNDMF